MTFLRFDWWRDENNRNGASALFGVLKIVISAIIIAAVAVAGWFGLDLGKSSDPKPTIQTGDNSPVQTGGGTQILQGDQGTVVIGMSIEQHQTILQGREAQLRADLTRASTAEKALIEQELTAVLDQMADLESSYQTALDDLRKLRLELAALTDRVPQDQLEAAQQALYQGDRSKADALLAEVEAQAKDAVKVAADAAYLRGEIAEQEIRWHDAAEHYERAARLDTGFENLLKARLLSWRVGDYSAALRFGQDMIAIARGEDDPSRRSLAYNEHALTLSALGRYAEAEELYRQALKIDRTRIGAEHPSYAVSLNNLALVLQRQGRFAEAEQLYHRVLKIDRATIGETHPHYASHLNNLALVIQDLGRYAEAEKLYRQALDIDRATIGEQHPSYGTHLNNLALVVQQQGRYAEAEALYRQTLEIGRATIGEGHPDYAIRLSNLGLVVHGQGKYAEAESLFRQALELDRTTLGHDHPHHATRLNNLALALYEQGQYVEAEELYRKALAVGRDTIGETHPEYAIRLNNLALVLHKQGRYPEARDLFRQALEIAEQSLGPDHPNTRVVRNNLADLAAGQGRSGDE